jgi:hypothetical protein
MSIKSAHCFTSAVDIVVVVVVVITMSTAIEN